MISLTHISLRNQLPETPQDNIHVKVKDSK